LVGKGVTAEQFTEDPTIIDLPASVTGFLRGELGTPVAGWPEPLRTRALGGREPIAPEPTPLTAADHDGLATDEAHVRRATLSRLLFPGPTEEYTEHLA